MNDEKDNLQVVVHQLAWLPHYLPIYWALAQYGQSVAVQNYDGGLEMFSKVKAEKSEHRLDIVLAGQFENYFDKPEARAVISDFVWGSILIHRAPLWIYSLESSKRLIEAQTESAAPLSKYPRIVVPPLDSTLYAEFKLQFAHRDIFQHADFAPSAEVFEISSALAVVTALKNHNAQLVVSPFPISEHGEGEGKIARWNTRVPRRYSGFTALWIPKIAVRSDDLLERFRSIQAKAHDNIAAMMGLDEDILDFGKASHREIVESMTARISEIGRPVEPLKEAELARTLGALGAPKKLHWEAHAKSFVADLAAAGIWGFNAPFAARPDGADRHLVRLSEYSLTSFLRQDQLDKFRGRMESRVKELAKKSTAIQELGHDLLVLSQMLEGSSDEKEIDAAAAWDWLKKCLAAAFCEPIHDVKNAEKDPVALWVNLKGAVEKSATTEHMGQLAKLQGCLDGIDWRNAGDEKKRIIRFLSTVSKYAQAENPFIEKGGADKNMIYEVKAISKGSVPLSWLGRIGGSVGGSAVDYRINVAKIAADAIASFNPVTFLRLLCSKEISSGQLIPVDRAANIFEYEIQFKRRENTPAGSLGNLAAYVYAPPGKYEGMSSMIISWLRSMGFALTIRSNKEDRLIIAMKIYTKGIHE